MPGAVRQEHLLAVRQAGGGAWDGETCHGSLRQSRSKGALFQCQTFNQVAFILQVDSKEQAEVYNIYLRKAAEIYGVTRTRQIYETAIETLKESESRDMCIRFSQLLLLLPN